MQLSHSLHNLVQLGLLSVCNVQYMGLENCLIGKDQTLHTGQAKWSAFNFSIIEVHLSKALKKKKWKCPYCMFARKWKNATIQSKSFKKPSNKMEKLNGIFFSTLAECWKMFYHKLVWWGSFGWIWALFRGNVRNTEEQKDQGFLSHLASNRFIFCSLQIHISGWAGPKGQVLELRARCHV